MSLERICVILRKVKNFFEELGDLSSVSLCCEILGNVASLGQNCIFSYSSDF